MNRRDVLKTTVVSAFGFGILPSITEGENAEVQSETTTNNIDDGNVVEGKSCYACEQIVEIKKDVWKNPRFIEELRHDGTLGRLRYYCSKQHFHTFEDNCKFAPAREYVEDGWSWDLSIEEGHHDITVHVELHKLDGVIFDDDTEIMVKEVEQQ